MISYTEYNSDGYFLHDILEVFNEIGHSNHIEFPFVIRDDGTVNAHGTEFNWTIRDGMFLFASNQGGHYSFEGDNLIIERRAFGYLTRRVFRRVD